MPYHILVGHGRYLSLGTSSIHNRGINTMIETLLFGIVLGLIPVTLSGLFVTAYLQYRRGDQLNL